MFLCWPDLSFERTGGLTDVSRIYDGVSRIHAIQQLDNYWEQQQNTMRANWWIYNDLQYIDIYMDHQWLYLRLLPCLFWSFWPSCSSSIWHATWSMFCCRYGQSTTCGARCQLWRCHPVPAGRIPGREERTFDKRMLDMYRYRCSLLYLTPIVFVTG